MSQSETSERGLGPIIAAPTFVPKLLAFKAGELAAVGALHLSCLAVVSPLNFTLTVNVGAPDHVRVVVDIDRKTDPLQSLDLLLGQDGLDYLLVGDSPRADAFKFAHVDGPVNVGL